jgi:carboxypeptidase Taq
MDRFEPGMTCAQVDRVFGDLRQWLPGLISGCTSAGRRTRSSSRRAPSPGGSSARCASGDGLLGFRLRRPAGWT